MFYKITPPISEQPVRYSWREQMWQDVELVQSLADNIPRLREEDFIDETKKGYSKKDIENDLKMTEEMKRKFHEHDDDLDEEIIKKIKEKKKRSEALESVIINGGQQAEWFGKEAHLVQTAEFDDIFDGVDGVLEFVIGGEKPQRIALAIDASMRPDFSKVERKILRGISKVNSGKMKVKYFKSQVDDFKGTLKEVIPIVLGLEGNNAEKLIHLFADLKRAQAMTANSEKANEKLLQVKSHPSQIIFLKEILVQLDMYAKIFAKEGNPTKFGVEKIHDIIAGILKDKETINAGEYEKDGVYQKICEVVDKQK